MTGGPAGAAMGGGSPIPDDARARLSVEFAGELYYEAVRQLEALKLEPHVVRSLVHLAGGDLDALRRYARIAERDPDQVVLWAEYEDHDASAPRKVRSMSEPLPASRR